MTMTDPSGEEQTCDYGPSMGGLCLKTRVVDLDYGDADASVTEIFVANFNWSTPTTFAGAISQAYSCAGDDCDSFYVETGLSGEGLPCSVETDMLGAQADK